MAGTTCYLQHLLVSWPLLRTLHLYQVYQCIFHFSYCLDYTRGVMHFLDCGLPINLEFVNRYLIGFWKHFKAVCWKVWTNLRSAALNCTQNFFVAADTILQYVSWHVCSGWAEIQLLNTRKLKTNPCTWPASTLFVLI